MTSAVRGAGKSLIGGSERLPWPLVFSASLAVAAAEALHFGPQKRFVAEAPSVQAPQTSQIGPPRAFPLPVRGKAGCGLLVTKGGGTKGDGGMPRGEAAPPLATRAAAAAEAAEAIADADTNGAAASEK